MPNGAEHKLRLGLAGEFFVAAELLRRDAMATVIYGNAKKMDIAVFSHDNTKTVFVEVKTSHNNSWVVGDVSLDNPSKPWVFVEMPADVLGQVKYYICEQRTVRELAQKNHDEYCEGYLRRHGRPYKESGVKKVKIRHLREYQDRWDIIMDGIV